MKLVRLFFLLLVLFLFPVLSSAADHRLYGSLYDGKGKSVGTFTLDRQTGRINVYSPRGQRLGWGTASGSILQFFNKGGARAPLSIRIYPSREHKR